LVSFIDKLLCILTYSLVTVSGRAAVRLFGY